MSILKVLSRPWLHFLLLGALLFYLQGKFFPEPLPVVGPLDAARVTTLKEQWFATTGQNPTAEQLQHMIAAELDRDMLFQHALDQKLHLYDSVVYQRLLRNMRFLQLGEGKADADLYQMAMDMRLHLGDEVIKRRLIQVMEEVLLAQNPPAEPSQTQIEAAFNARAAEFRHPPRYTIEQVYFDRQRASDIPHVIAQIQENAMPPGQARSLSSPFLPGYRFERHSPEQLARQFGAAFVNNLQAAKPAAGQWVGPIASTYGQHYVYVEAIEAARAAKLEEFEEQVRRDLRFEARALSLREGIARLREHYDIQYDGAMSPSKLGEQELSQ